VLNCHYIETIVTVSRQMVCLNLYAQKILLDNRLSAVM
jgi:hypothetical protein